MGAPDPKCGFQPRCASDSIKHLRMLMFLFRREMGEELPPGCGRLVNLQNLVEK